MESYDVIIIGAGPAGLKCAETIGNSNLKVLVIEKNRIIGPKVCGGLMTSTGMEYLNPDIDMNQFKYIIAHSILGETKVNLENSPIYSVDRKKLGQWQLKKLKKFNNLTVRTKTSVTEIHKEYIVANNKKIKFKYLVGADGSSSIVRRFLGLKTKKLTIAVQYIIPTKKYNKLEIFFDTRLFSAWYAWIIPCGDYVAVGAGCDPKAFQVKKLINNFNKWLKQNNIDIANGKYEAHSLNYDYQGICFGNIFLTGDAAGLVYGFTGEGIHQALVSGEEVGKKILDENHVMSLENIFRRKKEQDLITNILVTLGFLRIFGHELILYFLKNKIFRKRMIKLLF